MKQVAHQFWLGSLRRALPEGPCTRGGGNFTSDRSLGNPRAESGQGPPPPLPNVLPRDAPLREGPCSCAVHPFLLSCRREQRRLAAGWAPASCTLPLGAPGVLVLRVPDPYVTLLWPLEVWSGKPGGPGGPGQALHELTSLGLQPGLHHMSLNTPPNPLGPSGCLLISALVQEPVALTQLVTLGPEKLFSSFCLSLKPFCPSLVP